MDSNVVPITTQPADDGAETGAAVYTVKETARLLDLSLGVTYDLLRDGTIPARFIGRRWIIPRARFHRWLEELPDTAPRERAAG